MNEPDDAYALKPVKDVVRNVRQGGYFMPAIAGSIMLIASLLPWLRNPFGDLFSAWMLPVNLGGPLQVSFFNYGMLCFCCAAYCFILAFTNWRAVRKGETQYGCRLAGLMCCMPLALFFVQYLGLDLGAMNLLAQQKNQMLLVQGHFGYTPGMDFFPWTPFTVDISTIQERFQLLFDQLRFGVLFPLIAAWVLLDSRRNKRSSDLKKRRIRIGMISAFGIFFLLLLFMLVRTIGWMACQNLADEMVGQGNYSAALQWLNSASFFNPSLDETVFYHVERGQILYLQQPAQLSDDSRAYIASFLAAQNDYQDAYLQLLVIWQAHKTSHWVVDDMSTMLEHLAESAVPAQVQYMPQNTNAETATRQDSTAIPWLTALIRVNPGSVYGHYILGRIAYDLRDYSLCNSELATTLHLISDTDLQSSVYTYLALSDASMGDYAGERLLLLQALQFDPAYRNNTARQVLSGLR